MIKKKRTWVVYLILILSVLVILRIAFYFSTLNLSQEASSENLTLVSNINSSKVEVYLPAVDSLGNGTMTKLIVEAEKGTGRTLVSIDSLLFFEDTQQSIRVSRLVAQDVSNINLSNYDITYSIEANASVIGGPSAGAAITLATIAAVTGKKPKSDVIVSGTVNRDGSIGPVSEILEKAKASKKIGATIFLVPLLQSRDVVYETSSSCEKFGQSEICTEETKPRRVNITEETGMKILEVENIREAMNYFF